MPTWRVATLRPRGIGSIGRRAVVLQSDGHVPRMAGHQADCVNAATELDLYAKSGTRGDGEARGLGAGHYAGREAARKAKI